MSLSFTITQEKCAQPVWNLFTSFQIKVVECVKGNWNTDTGWKINITETFMRGSRHQKHLFLKQMCMGDHSDFQNWKISGQLRHLVDYICAVQNNGCKSNPWILQLHEVIQINGLYIKIICTGKGHLSQYVCFTRLVYLVYSDGRIKTSSFTCTSVTQISNFKCINILAHVLWCTWNIIVLIIYTLQELRRLDTYIRLFTGEMESWKPSELRFLGVVGGVSECAEFIIILGTDVSNKVCFSPLGGDILGEVLNETMEL